MSFLNKKSLFVPILLTIFVFGFSFNFSKAEELSSDIVVTTDPVVVVEEEVVVDNTTEESTNDLEVVTEPIIEAYSAESLVEPTPEILSAETSDEVDQSQNTTPPPTSDSSESEPLPESVGAETEQTASAVLAPVGTPTLSTDKDDYHPGETATIFGNFFAPLSNFVLRIFGNSEVGNFYTDKIYEVSSNDSGYFSFDYLLDNFYRPLYTVVASTLSGEEVAEMTFKDAVGASVDVFDQCANDDGDGYSGNPGDCLWTNGNMNSNNSTIYEEDSTVQRLVMSGLTDGPHVVTLEYQTTKGGKHAYDFLTDYNQSETWVDQVDLCSGDATTKFPSCASEPLVFSSQAIPEDSSNTLGTVDTNQNIAIINGNITGISTPTLASGSYASDSLTQINVTFEVDTETCANVDTKGSEDTCPVFMAWGAHVSSQADWGQGNSAVNISGSPYHMKVVALDGGSTGNRDNQMAAGAIPSNIIIRKIVPGGSAQSFSFTTSGTGYNGFNLISGGLNNQTLDSGNFTVTESVVPGWAVTDIQCTVVSGEGTTATPNIGNRSIAIVLGPNGGNLVDCTFTNTLQQGSLTIVKNTVGGNDAFNFNVTGPTPSTPVLNTVNNTATTGAVPVNAGNYVITETVPAGWDLTSTTCSDGSPVNNVAISAGENVTCTFTNTQRGHLIVEKTTFPAADTTQFSINASGNGTITGGGAGVVTDANDKNYEVTPGTYSVSETVPSGWVQTSNNCNSVVVAAGATATCQIVNTKLGHIIVDKVTVPGGDIQSFSFNTTGGSYANFNLTDAAQPNDQGLIPGQYSVVENPPTGWAVTGLVCDGTSTETINGNGTANITLGAGETVNCTFTNTKLGTIIVKKETLPDGSQTSFNFTRNFGSANFALTDGQQSSVSDLLPGTYSVAETVPTGWDLTSATCDDGSNPASIGLASGETVTCTFTNTQRGNIVIVKDVIGNPDPTDFTFNNNFGGNHPASFMLDEDTNADLPNSRTFEVNPGTYAVSEVQLPHWQLESATCSDQSPVGAIVVAPGETVTCTFVNEELNKITLIKNTIGGDGTFEFTMTGETLAPSAQLTTLAGTKTQVFEDIDQDNTYTISETVPAGWDLTSATCTGGNTPESITPEPGEDVTCTFTNTKKPTLTLQKTVVNDNGGTALETAWTLNANGPTPISGIEGNANVTNKIVDIGLYDLSESGPTGYTASAWVCTGAATQNDQDSVTLAAGENVTCVITNDDIAPKLHLRKVVVNDNGGTATVADFPLSANGTGSNDLSGTSPVDSGAGLIADTWTLSETPLAGYTPSDWVCVGGTQDGSNITVGIGGEATCTITNDDQTAHLKLVKIVTNNNGGSAVATDFILSATGPTPISGAGGAENDVNAGSYNLSETTLPGYTASAWSCEGGTQNGSSISLALGQSATCTITNDDQQAYIIVDKTVINDNGGSAQPNDFLLKVDGNAVLDGVAYPVNPGSHTASETTLPGYTASAWGTDCSANGSVTVALGQTKTCTITNDDQQAYIKVVKVVTNDNGGTADPDDFALTLEGTPVLSEALTPVNPGTYTAGETLVAGYSFTGFTGDCDSNGDTTVALGQTKTCTLTNDDIAPTLKLVKQVQGVGAGLPSEWTLTATGPTGISGNGEVESDATFDAGTYDLSESGPAGYLASAWSCVGGTQNGAQITVGLDQDAVCTITNTKILALEVSKTANTSFTRTYNWTIDKLVDDNTVDLFVGDSQTVNYDVTVTKTGSTDTLHAVNGTITIANPNTHADLDATITSINDVLNASGAATVDCGNVVFPYVLQNGAQLVCSYTKSGAATTDTLNTVTVATSGLVPGGQGTAPVSFDVPPATMTEVNKNIDVTDTFGGALGSTSETKTFEYSRNLACGSEQGQYQGTNNKVPNTATITQTNQSDDQNVVVNCYGLTVTKDAATSYTKTWTWTIDKVGDQTALTLAPDQIVPVNYDVTVNATSQDSAWAVSGNITINNPAPMPATVTVADTLTGNINATVNCPANEVPANDSLVCTYTSALPDATDRINTAVATLTNGTSFNGTAPVSFAGANVTVIDEEITIDDDKYAGNLGTLNANNAPKTFEYTINVGPYTITDCGTTDLFVNTATFTTNDTGATGSDNHIVTVNVQCVCSLTQGYWKTHNASFKGGAPEDINWFNFLPLGEKEVFFPTKNGPTGATWFQVFWTASKGNPYYNLAHQYMAAKLNVSNGAAGPGITQALLDAETLFNTYTPAEVGKKSNLKKQFTDLAGILGAFNEGVTNPAGHCTEPPL